MKVNFFSLHIGDFLGGTMGLDAQELGAYTSLLIAHYQSGAAGLLDDDTMLARMGRVTPKIWRSIKTRVMEKFDLADGRWTHSRVLEELEKMSEISAANSDKANKRWGKDKPKKKQKRFPAGEQNDSQENSNPLESNAAVMPTAEPGQSYPITNSQKESKKLVFSGKVIRLNAQDWDKLRAKSGLSQPAFETWVCSKDDYYSTLAEHERAEWWMRLNGAIKGMKR